MKYTPWCSSEIVYNIKISAIAATANSYTTCSIGCNHCGCNLRCNRWQMYQSTQCYT